MRPDQHSRQERHGGDVKIPFGVTLKNLDGGDLKEPKMDPVTGEPVFEEGTPEGEMPKRKMVKVTLLKVSRSALMANYPEDKSLDGEAKLARWKLAQKINGSETEVTAEEVVLLKTLIGKAFTAAIVGPAYTILEGNAQK